MISIFFFFQLFFFWVCVVCMCFLVHYFFLFIIVRRVWSMPQCLFYVPTSNLICFRRSYIVFTYWKREGSYIPFFFLIEIIIAVSFCNGKTTTSIEFVFISNLFQSAYASLHSCSSGQFGERMLTDDVF